MPKYGTHRRTGTYNDWGRTYKACSQALLGSGKALNQIALVELQQVAEKYLRDQDAQWPHSTSLPNGAKFGGDATHPWYSGQLHDSVAVRIMQKNRISSVHYMPPSPDTGKPQHTEKIKNIIGVDWAHQIAEGSGPRYFLPGVQVQLIVGVPYAEKVNESGRHGGFVDSLADDLFSEVNDWVDNGGLSRNVVVVADDKTVKVVKRTNVRRK